jgi:NAD(P)-dependent dehydrogenase (short-subunit alcohol dehydrogenase family)
MKLQNKNVLITGSAVRIGKQIAISLAQKGANILIHYNNSYNHAINTLKKIESYNVKANIIKADLSNDKDVKLLINNAIKFFGELHILINSASTFYSTPLNKINLKQWNDIINTNLRGAFFCSKYAGLHMVKNHQGKIINISDIGGITPWKNYSIYCISKAAIIAMTKALAKELAPFVQVNAIAPGVILLKNDIKSSEKEKLAAKNLLNRIGSPSDIIFCIHFIIESDFVTGSVFTIDGGQLIKT